MSFINVESEKRSKRVTLPFFFFTRRMINESPTRVYGLRATSLSHLSRRCPEGKLLRRIYESREFFLPLVCFALFYCLTFFLERWWDECDSFRGLGEQNPTSCQATINRLSRIWPLKKFTKRSWFWPAWCSDSLRIPCLEFIKVSLYRLKWVRNSMARVVFGSKKLSRSCWAPRKSRSNIYSLKYLYRNDPSLV